MGLSLEVMPMSDSAEAGVEVFETLSQAAYDTLWTELRARLRDHLGETAFRRWMEPVVSSFDQTDSGMALLKMGLPTRFMRDWVEAHYGDTVRTLWRQVSKGGEVEFIVVQNVQDQNVMPRSSQHPQTTQCFLFGSQEIANENHQATFRKSTDDISEHAI